LGIHNFNDERWADEALAQPTALHTIAICPKNMAMQILLNWFTACLSVLNIISDPAFTFRDKQRSKNFSFYQYD
jgi:hypothetical protein